MKGRIEARPFGYCEFSSPTSGKWYAAVRRSAGAGDYQLTVTTFGGDLALCGNNVVENGEACDGTDAGACVGGCGDQCACAACSEGDLGFDEIQFTKRLFLKAELHNGSKRYNGLDPRNADFTLVVADDRGGRLQMTIPATHAGWASSKPRRGLYRWRGRFHGMRRITLRNRTRGTGSWSIVIDGRNVPGAGALGYSRLTFTISTGGTCVAKVFP